MRHVKDQRRGGVLVLSDWKEDARLAELSHYARASREAPTVHIAQSNFTVFAKGAAALELAAVGLPVFVADDEGLAEAVPEAVVFVEFICSNGIMTASSTCMRPL